MSKSRPPDNPSHDGSSNTDHQRTYVADESGHSALIDAAGSAVSLPRGGRYVLRRQLGPVTLDRTLVTWYFDTDQRDLYANGSMLRWRGDQRPDGGLPSKGQLEARVTEGDRVQRTPGRHYEQLANLNGLDDPAISAVRHLTHNRPLVAVAEQSKQRRFLFAGIGSLSSLRPDFVIALDDVSLASHSNPDTRANRLETELQIFTKLPWLQSVDQERVARFEAFAEAVESKFSLRSSEEASYQAVPKELL